MGVYRIFNGGQNVVMANEQNGNPSLAGTYASTATTNMWMRLVRDPATNVITGSYSLDGSTWVTLGTVTRTITNPRLGIVAGTSPSGFPLATIHEVQIIADTAPVVPSGLAVGVVSGSELAVSWIDVAGETAYELEMREAGGAFGAGVGVAVRGGHGVVRGVGFDCRCGVLLQGPGVERWRTFRLLQRSVRHARGFSPDVVDDGLLGR